MSLPTSSSTPSLIETVSKRSFGTELVDDITKTCRILSTQTLTYRNWPAATRVLQAKWESMGKHEAVKVVVNKGTCYAGTRMMLFSCTGSPHAILLDEGYSFDKTTPAVNKDGYAMYDLANPTTDNVQDIVSWRIISKEHQSDPKDFNNSRFGRLLNALKNPEYQQPVGTKLGCPETILVNGARYAPVPECVMCKTVLHRMGGHQDCTLIAGHTGDHMVKSRRSDDLIPVPRNIPGITEGRESAQYSTGVLPGPVSMLSEHEKTDAASVMMSLNSNGGDTGARGASTCAGSKAGDGNTTGNGGSDESTSSTLAPPVAPAPLATANPATATEPAALVAAAPSTYVTTAPLGNGGDGGDGEEKDIDTEIAALSARVQSLREQQQKRMEKKRKELQELLDLERTLKKRATEEEARNQWQRAA